MTLPKLLSGERVSFLSMSVNQSITPLSTATMEVLKDDVLPIRTYIEIETPNGVKEYYRTRQPQESQGNDTATIQLDHAICEVGDYVIQDAFNEEKTVREAFVKVFSHYRGDKWQLGSFSASETVTLDVDYDNVLETMLAILEQQPKYIMTFNFSTSPWTVGIAQKSNTVTAEGRLSRNIAEAVVRRDDKDLCTRVYVKGLPKPSGREDDENAIGYMDADTVSLYGIVEKQTGSGTLTQAQAQRVATAYLNAHKHPKLSVEIDGDDLSDLTGETLDSFVCGKKFRLTVPDDNLVIEDYITKVTFNDVHSPMASIIIGEDLDPAINFLQDQASRSKSSGRGARKQEKENQVIRSEIYATGSLLYSYVERTATYLVSVVENAESQMGSTILQTAEQIYSEVHAANSTVYSYINQTATSITSRVEDVNNDLHSEILQTQSMIRSAVWTANSMVYSYVDQTASYILDHVGERTGAKVFTGMDEPVDTPENPITPGDLWLEGNYINFWDDADFPWVSYDPDDPDYDWSQLRGAKLKVWKDGAWQLATDDTTLAEDTELRRTKDQINLVAYNLVQTEGQLRSNIARIDVKADKITSTVNERIADVGSRITQTAYQIRAEVHSASSQLYSAIEQTATNIRSYVVDKINDVGSEILQTASQIRAEVHAANSTLYSYVDQTASYIRTEVADTAGGLSSRITQTASQIRSEVNAVDSKVYSSITQTASSIRSEVANAISGVQSSITQTANQIRSEVNAVDSKVYSSITQTASSIRSEVANSISGVKSTITQTANQIRSEVNAANSTIYSNITQTASQIRSEVTSTANGLQSQITQNAGNIELKVSKNGVISSINQTSESITINASKINLSGYVTSSNFSTVLANLASAHINKLYVDTNIYAPNGLSMYANGVWQLSLSRSGNTYTLKETKLNGDERTVGSFSRAVSSWEWAGGNGQVKVTAQPQIQTLGVDVRVSGNSSITTNGSYTYKVQYEDDNGSYWDTGATLPVTVNVKPTNLAIYDGNSDVVSSATVNPGSSLYLWAGYNIGSSWTWGSRVTISGASVSINSEVTGKNSQASDPGSSYSTISETKVPASDGGRWVYFTVNTNTGQSRKFKMHIKVV